MDRIMEQLSHPFMMILITAMLVVAVMALITALYECFKPEQVTRPQATKVTCYIKYEEYLRGLGNTDLRVLRDQYKNRMKSFMVNPERIDLMMKVDLIDHILHYR